MPSIGVKLYSVFFKFMLKHRLQSRLQGPENDAVGSGGTFGVTSRPDEETAAAANPSFTDGVATKDIHIDPLTSLSIRIFLPDTCLYFPDAKSKSRAETLNPGSGQSQALNRRNSYGTSNNGVVSNSNGGIVIKRAQNIDDNHRRSSYGGSIDDANLKSGSGSYSGYNPSGSNCRRLPVMLQFHGGGFVSGSNDSVANDFFCRRIAKLCDVIVLAVGYRLAPENKYPAAFEDGLKVLHWLAKQANLAECSKSLGRGGREDLRRSEGNGHVADAFGASMVEPWLSAHGDPSRCVLLGVSCGGNIADYVARKAVEAGKLLDPVRVVAQVLMYPFFIGSVPTHSEIKLANSYFYDKPMCILAWKLFLPEEEFSLDHPAANPLISDRGGPPLKQMPPTLTVVAEHDWMRDRAIAYSEELRKVNVDAPVLEYKDAVHEFATLDMLLKTPQAQACSEDIAIWVKKYISLRGHEFSY
ncbi:Arylacetamide deacetylase [Handroanthus impetiginosus]|uniref:Arylacetamide deacetylase n=1 Tax=Handroanthus impetiginosus TaxID=429701 RepID=A0A2G9G418_9LAMI|nr:Arylacetamide deacetylase [Handroanthus impetiginosus]PIN09092.1 Arylacetamide deacetylase [Handroanthus impetiginosus]